MTENFKQQERVTEEQKVQANGLKQQQYLLAAPESMTDTAIQYVNCGLSVVPIGNDKKPTVSWKAFQSHRPATSELTKWWANRNLSIGIICGQISGNLEVIDFDEKYNIDPKSIFERWRELVELELPGLVDTLVMQSTMNKGYHLLYRCNVIQGNQKLAQRDATEEEMKKEPDVTILTLIETRGERGYFLCYPSKDYSVFNGSLTAVPEITESQREIFLSCARALNQYVAPQAIVAPKHSTSSGNRPGDAYIAKGDHKLLLQKHGWHSVSENATQELWRRPGKTDGVSASYLKEKELFYVFSSNAGPLDSERAYNKFSLYTFLEADGDFGKAAKQLAADGYGDLSSGNDESLSIQKVEDYLVDHYDLRRNIVTTRVELCKKSDKEFHEIEDVQLNSLHRELQKAKLQIGIDGLHRELNSDFVETYDPFIAYFESLPAWDRSTDFIAELSKSVTLIGSTNDEFRDYLERWLIGMVACAIEAKAVNQTAIILVGDQGIGKGTWLNKLVPSELSKYKFVGTIDPENKDTQIYLSECILINLDELETLRKADIGALKTIMTLPGIKVRRPYDRLPQNMIRRASFVGSINQGEFLDDPTGSRRFLTFQVESVNVSAMPDMNKVMAQAYALFVDGERWWFDEAEIDQINKRNLSFSICGHEEELLLEHVTAPAPKQTLTQWLTATQIAERIKARRDDFKVDRASVREIGRALVKNKYSSKKVNGIKLYEIA